MPLIVCNVRAGLDVQLKARLASSITDLVHETIKSDLHLISVIFNDLASESFYNAGKPGNDVLIVCNIRYGRTDTAKQNLSRRISALWHDVTRHSEDHIEVAVLEYHAKYVFRGGQQMPEPPAA
jgi:phenylpyruvate tautomerase PptA (4-oxalocrotonate tautomerase family)